MLAKTRDQVERDGGPTQKTPTIESREKRSGYARRRLSWNDMHRIAGRPEQVVEQGQLMRTDEILRVLSSAKSCSIGVHPKGRESRQLSRTRTYAKHPEHLQHTVRIRDFSECGIRPPGKLQFQFIIN